MQMPENSICATKHTEKLHPLVIDLPLSFPREGKVAYITALAIEKTTIDRQNIRSFGISKILQSNLCFASLCCSDADSGLSWLVLLFLLSSSLSMNMTDPARSPTDTMCAVLDCLSVLMFLANRVLSSSILRFSSICSSFFKWNWFVLSLAVVILFLSSKSRKFADLDRLSLRRTSQKAVTVRVWWQWEALLFLGLGSN